MIITACGDSKIFHEGDLVDRVLAVFEKVARGESVVFYLGGYGLFDQIARVAAQKFKKTHKDCVIVFVTPYVDENYLKIRAPLENGYDEILYPDIEKTPKRFAIVERNKFMIRKADFVVAYVKNSSCGALKTLEYAKVKKKKFVNLADEEK